MTAPGKLIYVDDGVYMRSFLSSLNVTDENKKSLMKVFFRYSSFPLMDRTFMFVA